MHGISFGVHYYYLGHCISYAVVILVLLGAIGTGPLSIVSSISR